MPVAERLVEALQVLRSGTGALFRIRALVDIPIVLQAHFEPGAPHELPDSSRLGARQRAWLEGALDQRHVGQIQRQPLRSEHVLDHGQVPCAPAQALFEVPLQPPCEQLDERQHPRIQRNVDVVDRFLEIFGDRLLRLGRGHRGLEGRNHQQVVDAGGIELPLGEAVALCERRDLVGADPFHEAIEMLADPGLRACSPWRFEQDFQRTIEFGLRRLEVAKLQLMLARLEMARGQTRSGQRPDRARAGERGPRERELQRPRARVTGSSP